MKPTNFKQTCKYNKIMTSKEKIDELAEEFLTFHQDGSKVYHIKIREAIEFAYNKCQQDMVKDVESILNNSLYVDFISKKEILKYIKSLNKQD